MKSTARKIEPRAAFQEVCTVVAVDGAACEVSSSDGAYRAKRAASCLLAPEVGDEVLVAVVPGRSCWVISVLERDRSAPAVLEIDGDLGIRVPRGRLSIAAEGLDLVSGKETNMISAELNVRASQSNVVLEKLAFLGSSLLAEVKAARFVAETIDSAADRLVQRVKRVYRFIADVEHVRAERIDYRAAKDLSIQAENAVIMAEELVKVDGAQIHVG
jgi:Protein of unknown function (DUF3540)